ncbi:CDP-alcohol phosphatidyltransferase family protein [Kordiimonas marina]|uniref:CDP-alcohol phosphatidyltransferase family protein n=1 Tax=Kordiimonas marina TaxID=2872312 RepID=UPI001FF4ED31|nr:CDP-alcohol phosphatidyltransferase family protein [Kordiimonas marina]MCJ9429626.1 CDP-alcohol phosphatidyltransferase family protein [Kordiimonas marina]
MAHTATSTNGPAQAEYGRPASIEDASNRYFVHPISDQVVKVALALRLSANAISLIGLFAGLLAAVFYSFLPSPLYVLGGFLSMLAWHVFDGADGKVARATGTSSAFGRILDGICDHLVFGAVYIAFAFYLTGTGSPVSIWWLVIGAGLSHAVQAAGYEERRQKYQRRHAGVLRDNVQSTLLEVKGRRSFWAGLYDKVQKLVSGGDYGLDDALAGLRAVPGQAQAVTALISRTAPMVKSWGLLNANNRTALIAVFALLGQPALYFLFEIVVFNLVMMVLMLAEWRQEKALAALAREALTHEGAARS